MMYAFTLQEREAAEYKEYVNIGNLCWKNYGYIIEEHLRFHRQAAYYEYFICSTSLNQIK